MGKKKIEIPEDILLEMIRLYNEEYVGTPSLSNKFGYHKSIILRNFKDKGVVLGPSGRKWTGGKEVADKKWRNKNKEKLDQYHKEWSEKNREHLREYHTKWREDNHNNLNEYKRTYEKTKKDSDPKYKLASYTRTAIYTCLKERNISKYKNTFDLLPYSLDDLIQRLESQFKEGMSWDNYGEWHVDHIKPMSSFEFDSPEDISFQECWSLGNLQPLWAKENLSKGSTYL
jgi:hypothetical protein